MFENLSDHLNTVDHHDEVGEGHASRTADDGPGDSTVPAGATGPGGPAAPVRPARPAGPQAGDGRARTTRLIRATRVDVVWALAVAGAVNIALLLLAASALFGAEGTDTIEGAHAAITASLGPS